MVRSPAPAPVKRFGIPLVLSLIFITHTACDPAPRRTLTATEKTADVYWLYSMIDANYAPLEYKQQSFGFNYEDLKARYQQAAIQTATNEEFYMLLHQFVAEMRDAHTGSFLFSSSLPSRARTAYLGFSGVRKGNALAVTKLLPTIKENARYPIQVKDLILKLDGAPLADAVKQEMTRYRSLGQEESNLTYHMNKIFNRISLGERMPAKSTATLTVKRNGQVFDVTLPWIEKDLYTFLKEQKEAAAKQSQKGQKPESIAGMDVRTFFETGFLWADGKLDLTPRHIKNLIPSVGKRFWESFVFIDYAPTWTSRIVTDAIAAALKKQNADPRTVLATSRAVPDNVLFVSEAKTYPTYVSFEQLHDDQGNPVGSPDYVAYMRLDTFSPLADEDSVVEEFKGTVKTLHNMGVRNLVIDLIDNGGGSLGLGIQLAQLLSRNKLVLPELQFKLNESWLDEFEYGSLNAPSDTERELARRVFRALEADKSSGRSLSRPWNVETLWPYQIEPNADLTYDFRIAILVNEMCASMCDIFSAILQDNHIAAVVGARTMGAGGNVVSHGQAPNSRLVVNTTESLILRRDGSYLENNGVTPEVPFEVNRTVLEKYEPVRQEALKVLLNPPTNPPAAVASSL